MNPLVSVILPNYNHANYLSQRIESILNQTFQNFEIILLDDCSNDNSLNILNEYKEHDKVSQIIINNTNSGSPFKQWKKGIDLAKGELIWIAESDDYSSPFFLEEVIEPLITNKSIGLSYSQSYVVDDQSNELYINTQWTDNLNKTRWCSNYTNNGQDESINYLLYKNTIPNASAVVFRKELIEVIPTNFKLIGDWFFWISILLKSDISFIAKPLNYFRLLPSATRNHNTFEKRELRLTEGIKITQQLSSFISNKMYSERINFHYKYYLSILSLDSLLYVFIKPVKLIPLRISRIKLIGLAFIEIINRLKNKLNAK